MRWPYATDASEAQGAFRYGIISAMRVLTGIQPSGKLHWGNYFGAMKSMFDLPEFAT